MVLYINFDINKICKDLLQEQLDQLGLNYNIVTMGELELKEPVTQKQLNALNESLKNCHIEIVESQKSIMVQKIKDAIVETVFMEDKIPLKFSTYLAGKLHYNYKYLSNLFSSVTYTSIENFILLQKTERAKQLLAANELNVTEIGRQLNYSSTAHFSNQFKNVTGLTPSAFQRIINIKRNANITTL